MDSLKTNIHIRILPSKENLFQATADDFFHYVGEVLNRQNKIHIALSGGNTPKSFFALLAKNTNFPWERVLFFFIDERFVPADDPRSNYRMASESLFSKVNALPENIYRIPTEGMSSQQAALAYQDLLSQVFNLGIYEIPKFDLIYLGLGEDAHTASLMPLSELVQSYCEDPGNKNNQWVQSLYNPKDDTERVTLMPQVINNAKRIIFLVEGEKKAVAVQEVLEGAYDPVRFPGQLIGNLGEVVWFLDRESAAKLTSRPSK
jgi:6-phosphogluconolactonase